MPFDQHRAAGGPKTPLHPGVINAPSLLAELTDKSSGYDPRAPLHVINLSLLPHTEEDLLWLDAALGEGAAPFCRVAMATTGSPQQPCRMCGACSSSILRTR